MKRKKNYAVFLNLKDIRGAFFQNTARLVPKNDVFRTFPRRQLK